MCVKSLPQCLVDIRCFVITFTEKKDRKKNWFGTENEFDFKLCELKGPEALPGKKLEAY